MARMTKPFAVLTTLALSLTAFQGAVAAEEVTNPVDNNTTTTAPVDQNATTEAKEETNTTETKTETKEETNTETTTSNNTTPTPATGTEQPAGDTKEVKQVNVKLEQSDLGLKASLEGVTDAKGTWTLTLNGKQISSGEGASSFDFEFTEEIIEQVFGSSKATIFVAKFKGTSNGAEVKGEGQYSYAGLDIKAEVNKNKLTVNASLEGAKEAKGFWYVAAASLENEEEFLEDEKEGGLTHTAEFKNLKPGKYEVFVSFFGEVDGSEYGNFNVYYVEVKEDGSTGTVKPAPVEKPVIDKEKTEKVIKNAKGGKLPKTATNYPVATAAGAAALMMGAGLLLTRRNQEQ